MGYALEKLPEWPAGMSRADALAYTGVGDEQMREWVKQGRVRFRPNGPRGALITTRDQLDTALRDLFSGPIGDAEDFSAPDGF